MCIGPDCKTVRNPGRDSSLGSYIASGMFVSSSCQTVPVRTYLGAIEPLLKAICQLLCAISQFFERRHDLLVNLAGLPAMAVNGR